MTTRKSATTGSRQRRGRSSNSNSSSTSSSRNSGSHVDYWRIAGGIAGVAVTAFLVLTMFGGRRGLTEKARELLDWESEGHSPGSELGEALKGARGDSDREGLSPH